MSSHVPPVVLRTVTRLAGPAVFPPWASWSHPRWMLDRALGFRSSSPGIAVVPTALGEVGGETLTVGGRSASLLLYLHGGGYTVGSPCSHRRVASRLARGLNAKTFVPHYRRAPECPFPAAFDDAMNAYRALLESRRSHEAVYVAGDSAGGGLALALAVAARDGGLPQPAAVGLLCPAVDFSEDALDDLPRGHREPFLTIALLRRFRTAYLGGDDGRDPRVSPLLGDLTGIAPIVIDAAGYDRLRCQSRGLAVKARASGVEVRYREHRGMPHGFHSGAGLLRQADRALDDIASAMEEAASAVDADEPSE